MSLNKHDTIYRSYQLLTWLLLNCLSQYAVNNMTCSKQFREPLAQDCSPKQKIQVKVEAPNN